MSIYEQAVMNLLNLEFLLGNNRDKLSEKEIEYVEESIAQMTILCYELEGKTSGSNTTMN